MPMNSTGCLSSYAQVRWEVDSPPPPLPTPVRSPSLWPPTNSATTTAPCHVGGRCGYSSRPRPTWSPHHEHLERAGSLGGRSQGNLRILNITSPRPASPSPTPPRLTRPTQPRLHPPHPTSPSPAPAHLAHSHPAPPRPHSPPPRLALSRPTPPRPQPPHPA
jgi:hypothetical protein